MRRFRLLAAFVAVGIAAMLVMPAPASAAAVHTGHRHTTEVLRIWHPPVSPTSVSGSGLGTVRTYFTPMTVNGSAVGGGYMTGTLTTVAADAASQIEWRTSNLVFVMDASNVNQVVVGGVLPYSSTSAVLGIGQTFVRPVLGGSGAYAYVTGYVASVNRGADGWLHVFHLRS